MDAPAVAPEREVAFDLARRGLFLAPVALLVGLLLRGGNGCVGAALGIGVVLVNFLLAAACISWAAHKGPNAIGAAVLGGYVLRLAIVTIALALVQHRSFIDFPAFCVTLLVSHLGLLIWEVRYVGLSLAAPGLKPDRDAFWTTTSGEA